jgi:hypothetical protein
LASFSCRPFAYDSKIIASRYRLPNNQAFTTRLSPLAALPYSKREAQDFPDFSLAESWIMCPPWTNHCSCLRWLVNDLCGLRHKPPLQRSKAPSQGSEAGVWWEWLLGNEQFPPSQWGDGVRR